MTTNGSFSTFVNNFFNALTGIGTQVGWAIVVAMIVVGGIILAMAGTSVRQVETGKRVIFSALIGAAVIFTAHAIASLVQQALGGTVSDIAPIVRPIVEAITTVFG